MKRKSIAVSVIGLGKLGIPMTVAFATKGYRIIGVDVQHAIISNLNKGCSPVVETQVDQLLRKCQSLISATDQYEAAILESEISFVVVATPSNQDGSFSMQTLKKRWRRLGLH